MKKSLLLFGLTCMTALLTYSQSLQLSDSTGSIVNNSTIIKFGLPSDDEILSFIFVKNTTADSMSVKVRMVKISTLPGTMNVFCWGLCFDTSTYVSPDPIVIHAGRTDSTNFSGHYIPGGVSGNSTMRYVFFNANTPTDTVCVNVTFAAFPQGIKDLSNITLSDAYPNPANNSVNFSCSVPQSSGAKLILRNILGSVVKEVDIAGISGKFSLNTSELADGVYFYSFLVNGTPRVTKKLVIRH